MSIALSVSVRGIGLLGPGLADWSGGRSLLREPSSWVFQPTVLTAPARLPPAERRRAGDVVKLSMAVADQACTEAGADTRHLATVFTASSGDAANCNALCEALATPQRAISPTRFTNSVHNAVAGYWHIATTSRAPSTSLCAHDGSFGAGLLEAMAQCVSARRPVLLVAGDAPYPEPLHSVRPLSAAFGVALLLDVGPVDAPLPMLTLRSDETEAPASDCGDAALDALRLGVPAARSLPLLRALAGSAPASLHIEGLEGFTVEVRPHA
ncbi:beta-ketoacyl synthase chain length factor [Methylibium petroleiphilum]|uniref:beta-ketoacyl synthase chain length factor n=1 Tax=Methylibium petroleiphilum TaxID=105560 RepID=UPI001AC9C7EF|nr:beta-ketoacyl synthase chain length factor [Methylibium petroleiphilum]MBN9203213.1 beta-ketoacyl synthase chain length factor [Methylibium petroleiphilum]